MRRISIALLVGIVLVSVNKPISVYADTYAIAGIGYGISDDTVEENEFGTATLSEDGTLTVKSMPENEIKTEEYAWYEYKDQIKRVVFDDSISKINNSCFMNYLSIEEIVIGSGIKEISNNAFYGCNNLELIYGGLNIELIGESAFFVEEQQSTDKMTYLKTENEKLKSYDWFGIQKRLVCTDIEYEMTTKCNIEEMPVNYKFNNSEMVSVITEKYKITGQEDYVLEKEINPEELKLSTNIVESVSDNVIYVSWNYKNRLGINEEMINEVVIYGIENKPLTVELPINFTLNENGEQFISTEYIKINGSDPNIKGIKISTGTNISFNDQAYGTIEFGEAGEKEYEMNSILHGVDEKITINVKKDMIYSIGKMESSVNFVIITY